MLDLILPLTGAFLYRWRGMSSPYKKCFPRPFNQIVFAFPYAFITLIVTNLWWAALVVWLLTALACLTGRGNWIDLGKMPMGKPERLEFIIKKLRDKIPSYWYDVIGLAMLGLCITLPAGIATGNLTLALSGLLQAPAYMIASFTSDEPDHNDMGEALTGAFLYACLVS